MDQAVCLMAEAGRGVYNSKRLLKQPVRRNHIFFGMRLEQKPADKVRSMSNQRGNTQHPSAMLSDEIRHLQLEMARLMAHIAQLMVATVVSAPALSPALPPPPLKYATLVNENPSSTRKQLGMSAWSHHSSSIADAMRAVRSTDLAKKYPHLPWALLKELFEVEALMAADMVLSAPAALQILGPEIAQ
uniref:Uncharacterized protein n=1 Tax=Romanomermis culicivorax TaxID=13658 RepID=A0A915KZP6_ROMCU